MFDAKFREYGWLTLVALCAASWQFAETARGPDGRLRWGVIAVQIPMAFAIAVISHAAVPAVLYWFPYAGQDVAAGLSGVLAFLGAVRLGAVADAFLKRLAGK